MVNTSTMKALILSILTVLTASLGFSQNNPNIQKQLEDLNKYWTYRHYDDAILQQNKPLKGDVPLIQMHLSLVEQKLREETPANLSAEAKQNRYECLDILHDYWINGVFPINLYHDTRTPYFIDNFGTACAVGHLIVETGFEDVAHKIHDENNYAYIAELNQIYPELQQWADAYGFEMDELAWIQPGYAPCDTGCTATLYASSNEGTAPYSYFWSNGANSQAATDLCYGETYSVIIIDALGDTMTDVQISYQATFSNGNTFVLPTVQPVVLKLSTTPDYGNCEGTAKLELNNSHVPGFNSCVWNTNPQQYGTEANGLCAGWYNIGVYYGMGCYKIDSVEVVDFATNVDEYASSGLTLYPNPANNQITITLPDNYDNSGLWIYDSYGRLIDQKKLGSNIEQLDVSHLKPGVYHIRIEADGKWLSKKIIKDGQ